MADLTEDQADDLLYACRADDVEALHEVFSSLATSQRASDSAAVHEDYSLLSQIEALSQAKDEFSGNTGMHYACANGAFGILRTLFPTAASSENESEIHNGERIARTRKLFTITNKAGNSPLHYAALNGHLQVIKLIFEVAFPLTSEDKGKSAPEDSARQEIFRERSKYVSAKNDAGLDAAYEAEKNGKDEVVTYLLGLLDDADLAQSSGGREQQQNGDNEDDDKDEQIEMSMGDTSGIGADVQEMHISRQEQDS